MIIEEFRMLPVSICHTLRSNLNVVDFSLLLIDVMTIADEADSQLKHTIVSFSESLTRVTASMAVPALVQTTFHGRDKVFSHALRDLPRTAFIVGD